MRTEILQIYQTMKGAWEKHRKRGHLERPRSRRSVHVQGRIPIDLLPILTAFKDHRREKSSFDDLEYAEWMMWGLLAANATPDRKMMLHEDIYHILRYARQRYRDYYFDTDDDLIDHSVRMDWRLKINRVEELYDRVYNKGEKLGDCIEHSVRGVPELQHWNDKGTLT